jgi:hypothetical protein
MFPPNVGKSSSCYALSEMSYFHDLEKPGTFGFQKGILRNAAAEFSKNHKTGTVSRKPGRNGSLNKQKILILEFRFTIPLFDLKSNMP